jgi:hypothetical protein
MAVAFFSRAMRERLRYALAASTNFFRHYPPFRSTIFIAWRFAIRYFSV